MLTVRVKINIASQTTPQIIPVVQGDTGRSILFEIADFVIPAQATATYFIKKPSGHAVYNSATIDRNTVLANLTAQSIAEVGENPGQVRIIKNDEVVTSFDFILDVEPFRGIDAIESTTEMNIFDKAVQQALEEIDGSLDSIVADEFSTSDSYLDGEYVLKDGVLYRFTADHAAGAWSTSDTEAITVGEALEELAGGGGGGAVQSVNGQTGTVVLDAGDLEYDDEETYGSGTVGKEITDLKGGLNGMNTATSSDVGKALKAKTVTNGKVTEWEFGEAGGGSGLTSDIKQALLQLAAKVAYVDDDGQDYYDDLHDALYTLVSISAVYTQSGTVYISDSLDSLKADLVVTALYDDQSTETITNYTLSGTLTAGTSTITVSYSGKTTTFNVFVTANPLPSGYTGYDYIESTTTMEQWQSQERMIRLQEYSNLNRISIEFPFLSKEILGGIAIIGGRPSTGSTSSFAFYSSSNDPYCRLGYHVHGVDSSTTISFTKNTVHELKYVATTETPSVITLDNDNYNVTWSNDNTINAKLTLFSNPSGTSSQRISNYIQIGRIKVYDINGDKINDYLPCVRSSDNVIGMYDIVNSIFYTTANANYATIGNSNCIYTTGDWA